MRFYTKTHKHYCGIDLHAKKMFLCILDAEGNVLLHRNIDSSPEAFLKAVGYFLSYPCFLPCISKANPDERASTPLSALFPERSRRELTQKSSALADK